MPATSPTDPAALLPALRPRAALGALLGGILDYAGLFPPARLPLAEAITNYARYRASDAAWMLGDFIVPATRLAELGEYGALFSDRPPFCFSALIGGGEDAAACLAQLDEDVAAIDRFTKAHMGRARVHCAELRLPRALFAASTVDVRTFLQRAVEAFGSLGVEMDRVFVEVPVAERAARRTLLRALPLADAEGLFAWATKLRLGGVNPGDHPPPEPVAEAIADAHAEGVPFKATAGLHHPLRHHNAGAGEPMHGFLNVFGGAVLVHAGALQPSDLLALLEDEDAAHFRFTDTDFAWQGARVGLDAIRRARAGFALRFGSCSLAEPLDDLAALGLG